LEARLAPVPAERYASLRLRPPEARHQSAERLTLRVRPRQATGERLEQGLLPFALHPLIFRLKARDSLGEARQRLSLRLRLE
jgi:hypothetical protein